MILEQEIRVKMQKVGWKKFMDSFSPNTSHDLRQEKRLCSIITILGSSRLPVAFEIVGDEIVNEHKLQLLMEFLDKRPDCIPIVEGRL